MALLSAPTRQEVLRKWNEDISRLRLPISITRTDMVAAIAAIDAYFDTNESAINQAIPQPARGALDTADKARLVVGVIRARYGA